LSEREPSNTEADSGAAARVIMPPHVILRDFLAEETVAGLLDYALAHADAFAPTGVGRSPEKRIEPHFRVSLGMRDLGPFKPILTSKILALVPDLVARLGTTAVDAPELELQLVAHTDGAFYKRHIDTQTASEGDHIRVLSGIYYFFAEPKAFAGGELRLYAIGSNGERYVDIEPARNSFLVFPSWAAHEVMPVSCPSKRFIDSRFAINCWMRRKRR
jgi:SM-20-related protein